MIDVVVGTSGIRQVFWWVHQFVAPGVSVCKNKEMDFFYSFVDFF